MHLFTLYEINIIIIIIIIIVQTYALLDIEYTSEYDIWHKL